ncbi:MAG: acyloxyacyl hydrolase [Candidatus Methylacidiphilales bacterium]
MFAVAAGARYDFTDEWFLRGAVVFTHVSNAGLSEPQFDNESLDGIGPQLSLGYRF